MISHRMQLTSPSFLLDGWRQVRQDGVAAAVDDTDATVDDATAAVAAVDVDATVDDAADAAALDDVNAAEV